jgi:hypothetical protein
VSTPSSFLGSELQQRTATPPPLIQSDPDTPKKGNKRMSKDEEPWTPTVAEVKEYCSTNDICGKCCKSGHRAESCQKGGRTSWNTLSSTIKFRPHLEQWASLRRKRGGSWRFYDVTANGPYNPPVCNRCHQLGHTNTNCKTILKCNHCSQDHLGIDCPQRPEYAFEAMDIHQ